MCKFPQLSQNYLICLVLFRSGSRQGIWLMRHRRVFSSKPGAGKLYLWPNPRHACFVNTPSHLLLFTCSWDHFKLHKWRALVSPEPAWPTKTEIFITWSFQRSFADPLSKQFPSPFFLSIFSTEETSTFVLQNSAFSCVLLKNKVMASRGPLGPQGPQFP